MRIALHSPDDRSLSQLRNIILRLGHDPVTAPSIGQAASLNADLVLAEWALLSRAEDLFAGLETAAGFQPPVPVVVLLSSHSRAFADRVRLAGAADVLFLPPDPLEIQAEIEAVELRNQTGSFAMADEFARLRDTILVGEHPRFRKCLEELLVAAKSDANVLLLGETGVGKEMFARSLHSLGARARHPYLAVNCANLPGALLESELFGHVRGAFTGADKDRAGRLEEVGEGALLLDEIGDMEPSLQMKLLRVVEQREFQRLGANRNIPMRARLICATSVDLEKAVGQGRFRRDLLGRINQLRIVLPPLRERRSDIILLAERLLYKHARTQIELSESTKQVLLAFQYPMNVRQLENIMISALAHAGSRTVILPRDLPDEVLRSEPVPAQTESIMIPISASLDYQGARAEALRAVDAVFLPRVLSECAGNQSAAASALGVDRKTFGSRYHAAVGGGGDELLQDSRNR
jgi:two-component system NtrC family response regulator